MNSSSQHFSRVAVETKFGPLFTILVLAVLRETPFSELIFFDVSLQRVSNYSMLGLAILILSKHAKIILTKPYILLSLITFLDFLINTPDITDFLIRVGFLLVGYSFLLASNREVHFFANCIGWLVTFGAIVQLVSLYIIDLPPLSFNQSSWLIKGWDIGIKKAHLSTLYAFSVLYLIASKRYRTMLFMLLLGLPLLVESRSAVATTGALVLFHCTATGFRSPRLGLILIFTALSSLVLLSLFIGEFDRLHSYAIATDLMLSDPTGIGLRQYPQFTREHFHELNEAYSAYLKPGDKIYFGTESMFADLIASYGIFSLGVILTFYIPLHACLINYLEFQDQEKFLILGWGLLFFIGIASDHTHIDAWFFIMFGLLCNLAIQRQRRNVKPGMIPNAYDRNASNKFEN